MVIDIGESVAVIDEAAAILEAEWLRLIRDDGSRRSAHGVYAEVPAACLVSPHVTVVTCAQPGPLGRRLHLRRPCPPPRRRATRVWATQRSPPKAAEAVLERQHISSGGGDALTGNRQGQRGACRPQLNPP